MYNKIDMLSISSLARDGKFLRHPKEPKSKVFMPGFAVLSLIPTFALLKLQCKKPMAFLLLATKEAMCHFCILWVMIFRRFRKKKVGSIWLFARVHLS